MKDTYVYELDGNLYINLTNRCSNDCKFCVRNGKESYYGHKLWLNKEPTVDKVLGLIGDKPYNEIVFCGFGEPTFRIKEVIDIAKLNKEIEEIVAREQILRDEIAKIIAEIEV